MRPSTECWGIGKSDQLEHLADLVGGEPVDVIQYDHDWDLQFDQLGFKRLAPTAAALATAG
jgi:hypothetical protein